MGPGLRHGRAPSWSFLVPPCMQSHKQECRLPGARINLCFLVEKWKLVFLVQEAEVDHLACGVLPVPALSWGFRENQFQLLPAQSVTETTLCSMFKPSYKSELRCILKMHIPRAQPQEFCSFQTRARPKNLLVYRYP